MLDNNPTSHAPASAASPASPAALDTAAEPGTGEPCPRCWAESGHRARCSRRPIVIGEAAPYRPLATATAATRTVVDSNGVVVGWDPGYRAITRYEERVAGPEGR